MSSDNSSTKGKHYHQDELEWIQFREDALGPDAFPQSQASSKFFAKVISNPFVPLGALCTVGALSYGLWSFRKGQVRMSQKMMRMRVAAQGLTIVAIMGGLLLSSYQSRTSASGPASPAPT